MAAVLHAFPSFHGINGRSLALAFIIVVHAAFFVALTTGLRPPILDRMPRDIAYVPIDRDEPTPPPPGPVIDQVLITPFVPADPGAPDVPYDDSGWFVREQPRDEGPLIPPVDTVTPKPVIVQPQIDTQRGLREPVYPPQEVRLNHTGTVLLSVEVLPSGRVGDVRVVQSTGYPRLDEAAIKAAREWHLRPGTRDGVPTAMWKQIPITFRLRE